MKHISFSPKGVCAQQIDFDVDEGGALHNVKFVGGCNGNLKAIGLLVEGQDASSIAETLRGNICGFKQTSCADQLAIAIEQALR
ncbi:MAG: TIGR03905 family TSCPD domain-containing protein [Clostridiales bacterium]|nr:TIGR03905 family TSCPD domain-containing protein [Clostridiales bacterium]